MKSKIVLATVAMLMLCTAAFSQRGKKALSIMGAYAFQDKVTFYDAYGYIRDGGMWNVGFEYFIDENRAIELGYTRMDTKVPLYTYNMGVQLNSGKERVSLNYILVGVNNYLPLESAKILPYFGAGLGVGIADAKDASNTYTKFAWNIKGGLQLKTSAAVSFKLQAQLLSIAEGISGGFYVGTGGSGASTYTYSSIFQFTLGGGVCFSF